MASPTRFSPPLQRTQQSGLPETEQPLDGTRSSSPATSSPHAPAPSVDVSETGSPPPGSHMSGSGTAPGVALPGPSATDLRASTSGDSVRGSSPPMMSSAAATALTAWEPSIRDRHPIFSTVPRPKKTEGGHKDEGGKSRLYEATVRVVDPETGRIIEKQPVILKPLTSTAEASQAMLEHAGLGNFAAKCFGTHTIDGHVFIVMEQLPVVKMQNSGDPPLEGARGISLDSIFEMKPTLFQQSVAERLVHRQEPKSADSQRKQDLHSTIANALGQPFLLVAGDDTALEGDDAKRVRADIKARLSSAGSAVTGSDVDALELKNSKHANYMSSSAIVNQVFGSGHLDLTWGPAGQRQGLIKELRALETAMDTAGAGLMGASIVLCNYAAPGEPADYHWRIIDFDRTVLDTQVVQFLKENAHKFNDEGMAIVCEPVVEKKKDKGKDKGADAASGASAAAGPTGITLRKPNPGEQPDPQRGERLISKREIQDLVGDIQRSTRAGIQAVVTLLDGHVASPA